MRARRASVWILCGVLHSSIAVAERATGTVLPVPPSIAPGGLNLEEDPMSAARVRFLQGDMEQVVALVSPHLADQRSPASRGDTVAHFMLAMAHRSLENWNLAAAHFWWVRTSEQPLAPFAAWYEAETELHRGRSEEAIEACTLLREQWPEHRMTDECLLVLGDAWSLSGNAAQSQAHFDQWLKANRTSSRSEAIRLRATLALARIEPKRAISPLQRLLLDHQFHSTAVSAQRALKELAKKGLAELRLRVRKNLKRIGNRRCGERGQ